MARLQILELPEGSGDDRPSFALVVDQYRPLRYMQGLDQGDLPEVADEFEGVAEKIGARVVLVFQETVEIPANGPSLDADEVEVSEADFTEMATVLRRALGIDITEGSPNLAGWLLTACRELEKSEAARRHLREERVEARQWARHGYEIGQKHCGWSDHGVAPDWLTEGWPPHFDSCKHLKQMAEFDEALTRVRGLPTEPEVMNSEQEHPSVWLHGYKCGVLAARSAAVPRDEKAARS